jgi:phage gpG-like protein
MFTCTGTAACPHLEVAFGLVDHEIKFDDKDVNTNFTEQLPKNSSGEYALNLDDYAKIYDGKIYVDRPGAINRPDKINPQDKEKWLVIKNASYYTAIHNDGTTDTIPYKINLDLTPTFNNFTNANIDQVNCLLVLATNRNVRFYSK